VFAVLALAALVLVTYRSVLGLELMGGDTFTLILTARIDGFGDLFSSLTEELMDGRDPGGHYYRPLLSLSFALDHALWGIDPLGYHLSDLGLLLANALLLALLARRLFGPGAELAGVVASVAFAMHPLHLEVLSAPPRRGDALCLAFTLGSLLCMWRPDAGAKRRLFAGLLALAAIGAKETGIVLVPLAFGLGWLRPRDAAHGTRLRHAIRESSPLLIVMVLFLAVRTLVLGGLGGYAGELPRSYASNLMSLVVSVARWVVEPQPLFAREAFSRAFVVFALLCLLTLAVLTRRRPAAPKDTERRWGQSLTLMAIWVVCLLGVTALSGYLYDWYALPFLAPYGLLLGFLAQRGIQALELRDLRIGLPAFFLPLALVASHFAFSPLLRSYPELTGASEYATGVLERLESAVADAEPGERVVIDRFASFYGRRKDGSGVRNLGMFRTHSLQAYAELVAPDKPVLVRFSRGTPPVPVPGVVDVILVPGQSSQRSATTRAPTVGLWGVDDDQREAMLGRLQAAGGGNPVWFATSVQDSQAEVFQRELEDVFLQAGWQVRGNAQVPFRIKAGLYLFMADREPPEYVRAARAALEEAGFQLSVATGYRRYHQEMSRKNPDWKGFGLAPDQTFVIVVGRRP
jgi:hypothetical protein